MTGADVQLATDTRPADHSDHVPAPDGRNDPRDPWLCMDDQGVMMLPLAGQAGHGCTASLRRQPTRIVNGRMEGGYTSVFELICCQCGDHPYLDYLEISPRLQRIRGPYTIEAGLAAYEKHLGLTSSE
jgi:hypothetical protein